MTITIHEALIKYKTLRSQINKKLNNTVFVGVQVGSNGLVNGVKKAEFEKIAKAEYQSIMDLIAQMWKIKRALLEVNSGVTKDTPVNAVDFNGEKMTLIQLKEYDAVVLTAKQNVFNEFEKQYTECVKEVESKNAIVDTQSQKLFNNESKDVDAAMIERATQAYRTTHGAKLIDPNNLAKLIPETETEVSDTWAAIDGIISRENALRTIEI